MKSRFDESPKSWAVQFDDLVGNSLQNLVLYAGLSEFFTSIDEFIKESSELLIVTEASWEAKVEELRALVRKIPNAAVVDQLMEFVVEFSKAKNIPLKINSLCIDLVKKTDEEQRKIYRQALELSVEVANNLNSLKALCKELSLIISNMHASLSVVIPPIDSLGAFGFDERGASCGVHFVAGVVSFVSSAVDHSVLSASLPSISSFFPE